MSELKHKLCCYTIYVITKLDTVLTKIRQQFTISRATESHAPNYPCLLTFCYSLRHSIINSIMDFYESVHKMGRFH